MVWRSTRMSRESKETWIVTDIGPKQRSRVG